MKIISILGARPQFVKAAMVSQALARHPDVNEKILHTGQHYDPAMSAIFFQELDIPEPYKNLDVGSGPHGKQTARMLIGIEEELLKEHPDCVLVYGDTNSTLAGALAAAKLHIPVAHVEAGLRSFNQSMPEEINRMISDRLSHLLFAPTSTAVENLKREGITDNVHQVGDVMIDAIFHFREKVRDLPKAKRNKLIPEKPYLVLTLHRQENTDDQDRLQTILQGLRHSPLPLVFPLHPRTRKTLSDYQTKLPERICLIDPLSYLEMIALQDQAEAVWTDSGGMQKEAVVLGKRCFTLRDETEWTETVETGWNQLVKANENAIRDALLSLSEAPPSQPFPTETYYGNGRSAKTIAKILKK